MDDNNVQKLRWTLNAPLSSLRIVTTLLASSESAFLILALLSMLWSVTFMLSSQFGLFSALPAISCDGMIAAPVMLLQHLDTQHCTILAWLKARDDLFQIANCQRERLSGMVLQTVDLQVKTLLSGLYITYKIHVAPIEKTRHYNACSAKC